MLVSLQNRLKEEKKKEVNLGFLGGGVEVVVEERGVCASKHLGLGLGLGMGMGICNSEIRLMDSYEMYDCHILNKNY